MMLVIYKLIAEILVECFIPYSYDLIDAQQIGFILDCYILENTPLTWIIHDWVLFYHIPTLFVKLDFQKAFDHVEHTYIWQVLIAIGLDGKFLTLV